eukprot:UN00514
MSGNIFESTLGEIGGDLGVPVMRGHSDGELWAVCDLPTDDDKFISAGEDNKIMVWSKTKHACVAQTIIDPEKVKRRNEGALERRVTSHQIDALEVLPPM